MASKTVTSRHFSFNMQAAEVEGKHKQSCGLSQSIANQLACYPGKRERTTTTSRKGSVHLVKSAKTSGIWAVFGTTRVLDSFHFPSRSWLYLYPKKINVKTKEILLEGRLNVKAEKGRTCNKKEERERGIQNERRDRPVHM